MDFFFQLSYIYSLSCFPPYFLPLQVFSVRGERLLINLLPPVNTCLLLKPTSIPIANCLVFSVNRRVHSSSQVVQKVSTVASIIRCALWFQTTSRYPARSLLTTGLTTSRSSCQLYTPSQATYSDVSVPTNQSVALYLPPTVSLCFQSTPSVVLTLAAQRAFPSVSFDTAPMCLSLLLVVSSRHAVSYLMQHQPRRAFP